MHHAIAQCNGNVPSVTNVPSLMMYLKNQGVRYIIVKAGTGDELFGVPGFNPQLTSSLVNQAHAAGLWIFGYNRSYATNTAGEVAIANYVFEQGADGFVWDAEAEWEYSRIGTQGPALAIAQCSQVRSNWPTKFLAHSPFAYISGHSSFPYKEFGYYCDAAIPQDYFIQFGDTPTACVTQMNSEWRNWQNNLTGQWKNSIKPIVPAGQGWHGEGTITPALITEFVTALKNVSNPATAGGYKGVNYWVCEMHPTAIWPSIATNEITVWSNAPVIANVSAGNVNSSSATIHWTTDQSSDSVVEYGLDLSYGTLVTNSTPIYYHTVNLTGLSPYTTYYYRVKSRTSNNQTGVSGVDVFATSLVSVPDIVVDDADANVTYTGAWTVTSGSGYNGSYRWGSTAASETRTAIFRPTIVTAGNYHVFVRFIRGANRANNAPYTVSYNGGSTTVAVDQSGSGDSGWVQIASSKNFASGTGGYVRLSNNTGASGSVVIADAVQFIYAPVTNPPAIVTQPVAGQTNVQGSTATFSVVASGSAPLEYQWRLNGANIADAILSSYTKNNVQPADAGTYTVVVTNVAGAVTSSASVLTVVLPARITVQPVDVVVRMGSNTQFTVTASGTAPLSYQWQFNGTNIAGATTSVLTITNAQAANAGPYAVLVTNLYDDVLSSIAELTVLDPFIVAQPQNQSVAAGATATFTVSAGGTPALSYQWRKEGNDLANGGNISGAQTASLTVSNVQAGDLGNYSVMVSNTNGWVVSSNATLTAPFPPVIWGQPASQIVVAGSAATFTAGASSPGLTFQWKRAGTNVADGTKFSGSATASLTVSNAQGADMAAYSVGVSNSYGGVVSSNALLGLRPLAAWGHNTYNQSDVQPGLSNVLAVAGGYYHSLALKADGTVAAWGAGTSGQTNVPVGLANVAAVAAGVYHNLALKSDGTVTAWGYNNAGQTNVPIGLANVVAVAAGFYHSLALKGDGTVAAWGITNSGSNYGQTNNPSGLTNVVGIAVGWHHNLALKADGAVVAWGAGTNNTGSSPHFGQAQVPGGLNNVVAVAAGAYHSLALKADGTVVAWGAGTTSGANPHYGQSLVPEGLSNVVAIAAGTYHSLALRADGSMVAWGAGTANTGSNPQYGQSVVPGGLSNTIGIAGGGYHTLALENDGRPYITVQPFNQTASAGATVTLAALVAGAQPLSYQWQRDGTNVPGGTGAVLTMANVQSTNAGSYSVVATNAQGTATSASALLTVIAPPTITTQPQSLSINQGSNATFAVVAAGTLPLSYQWTFNGTNISGATASSYTCFAAQAPDTGSYAVVVTNSVGSVTSSNAILSFNVPPGITTQPGSVTVIAGSNVTFTVAATGTLPLSWQWTFNGTNLAGAIGTSYTRLNAQPADAGSYAAVVSNMAGSVTSSNAVLTVNVPPAITTHPQSASVAAGSNVTFTVAATGTPAPAYQWRFNGTNLAYATRSAYTCYKAQTHHAGTYSVVISNAAGTTTSSNALLTVLAANPLHIDSVARLPDGRIELQISGGPGSFAIECAPALAGWTQLSSLTATGAVFQYIDPETNQASRFYRVRLLP